MVQNGTWSRLCPFCRPVQRTDICTSNNKPAIASGRPSWLFCKKAPRFVGIQPAVLFKVAKNVSFLQIRPCVFRVINPRWRRAAGLEGGSRCGRRVGGHRWRWGRPEQKFPGGSMTSMTPGQKETGGEGEKKEERRVVAVWNRRRLATADNTSRRCVGAV